MEIVTAFEAATTLLSQLVKLYQENKDTYSATDQATVETLLANATSEYQTAFASAQTALRG